MDAVKFMKEKDRLCGAYVCDDCPLLAKGCDDSENIEELVEIVEKWSNEHPVKTRADVFREMFPLADSIKLCPIDIQGKNCEDYWTEKHDCDICKRKYWDAPAPDGFGKGGAKCKLV